MIRILIVDPDKNLRGHVAENLLQQHGTLIIDQAASGNEAIQRMTNGEKYWRIGVLRPISNLKPSIQTVL